MGSVGIGPGVKNAHDRGVTAVRGHRKHRPHQGPRVFRQSLLSPDGWPVRAISEWGTGTLRQGAILCDFDGCWNAFEVSSPIERFIPTREPPR